jgi:hypothetical protein
MTVSTERVTQPFSKTFRVDTRSAQAREDPIRKIRRIAGMGRTYRLARRSFRQNSSPKRIVPLHGHPHQLSYRLRVCLLHALCHIEAVFISEKSTTVKLWPEQPKEVQPVDGCTSVIAGQANVQFFAFFSKPLPRDLRDLSIGHVVYASGVARTLLNTWNYCRSHPSIRRNSTCISVEERPAVGG